MITEREALIKIILPRGSPRIITKKDPGQGCNLTSPLVITYFVQDCRFNLIPILETGLAWPFQMLDAYETGEQQQLKPKLLQLFPNSPYLRKQSILRAAKPDLAAVSLQEPL